MTFCNVEESTLDEPDVPWGPENYESLPLYVLEGNRPDEARVEGISSVVAHHKDLTFGYRHRTEGASVRGALVNVGFLLALAVHEEHAVLDRDFVSWQSYNPLYQILLATLGATLDALKDYDVVVLGLVEAVDELIDEDPVSYLKGRYHALRRDPESLYDERAYETEDQSEGDQEYNQELDQALGLWGHGLSFGILRQRASNLSAAWLVHTHFYTTAQRYPGVSGKPISWAIGSKSAPILRP